MPVRGSPTDWHFFSTCVIVEARAACYAEFMAEQQRVIVYGDSLILAGVQASLSVFPSLELITMEELPADWVATLHELQPSAVIFDMGSVPPDFPLAVLQQSKLLLIGVDAGSAGTLVLSSRPAQALSAGDLVNLISHKDSLRASGKGEG